MENNIQQPLASGQQTDQLHSVSAPTSHSPSKAFIILIVVLLILTVSVGGYILGTKQNQVVQSPPQPVPPNTQPSPTSISTPSVFPTTNLSITADWKTYRNEEFGFEVKFPEDKFALVPVERVRIVPPSSLSSSTYHDGLKLIRPRAKDRLGEDGCMYGQMGPPGVVCNAAMEDGISLLIIEKDISEYGYTTGLEEISEIEVITIAKRNGIKYTYAGAGSGTSHYFIPIRENLTLVVTKDWIFDFEDFQGRRVHDSVPEFDQILSTFKFSN